MCGGLGSYAPWCPWVKRKRGECWKNRPADLSVSKLFEHCFALYRQILGASYSARSLLFSVPAQCALNCLFARILDHEQHAVRIRDGLVDREDARQRSVRPQFALLE